MPGHDNRTQLPVGARVRSRGQQYADAHWFGTATIVEVVKQHVVDGTWEYLVRTDEDEIRSWNMVDTPEDEETRRALGVVRQRER